MNEEGEGMVWSIDSSTGQYFVACSVKARLTLLVVYSKVVTTALRYTPVVLEHHVPYKTLSDGRL
jgi:nucleolar complex protein 2